MRTSALTPTGDTQEQQARSSGPAQSAGPWRSQSVAAGAQLARLLRYLPLSVLVTAAVTALPIATTARLVPDGRGVASVCLSAALAMALSVGAASALAAGWRRWSHSRELLFGDLLLWGWVRRLWAEWRLLHARAQFESIAHTGAGVGIALLERVTRVLQARDPQTHGHSQRVTRHAVGIARAMRLPPEQVAKIRAAAAVHDVGKIYTPQAILNNPGKLSDEEFEIVKRHAADGAGLVGPAGDREITAMVRHHHERLNGSGYPDGLVGERIPLGARIIAVADCFDAITSTRTYHKARSHKAALDILAKEAGSELDADAVTAFRRSYSPRRTFAWAALATFATAVPQRSLAWLQGAGAGLGVGSLPQVLPLVGAAGALVLAPHGHNAQRSIPARTARNTATAALFKGPATPGAAPAEQGSAPRLHAQAPAALQHTKTRSGKPGPIASIPLPAAPERRGGTGNSPGPSSGSGGSGSGSPGPGSSGAGASGPSGTGSPPSQASTAPTPAPESQSSGPSQPTATITTPPAPLPVPEVSVKTPSVGAVIPSVGVSVGGGNGSSISVGVSG
jgi:HD-GYP domain-containing protein (c-di-GMP phosphodiesterase class II)